MARDRGEQRPDRFAEGEKVDAKITNIEKGSRKLSLSIKAKEVEEEKEAMAEYGSSDAGASLGDILGAALKSKEAESGNTDDPTKYEVEEVASEPTPEEETSVESTETNEKATADTDEKEK